MLNSKSNPVDPMNARARRGRKIAYTLADMPLELVERIANNRMSDEHLHLDALMDDDECPRPPEP